MNYHLTFKIFGHLQGLIIDAETWEHALAEGERLLARMRYRRRNYHGGITLVGVGFCVYMEVK